MTGGAERPNQKDCGYLVTFPAVTPGTLAELVLYSSLCLLKPRDGSCDQLLLLLSFPESSSRDELVSNGEQSVSGYINPAKKLACFVVK